MREPLHLFLRLDEFLTFLMGKRRAYRFEISFEIGCKDTENNWIGEKIFANPKNIRTFAVEYKLSYSTFKKR